MEKITDKSVIFKAVEVEEESHDAQDLPLPLNQVAEKFASEHKGEGEVTIVTGFPESLHLSQNQCDSIEKATRAQSQCTEWVEQRKGRITASKFHEVHTKVKTLLPRPNPLLPGLFITSPKKQYCDLLALCQPRGHVLRKRSQCSHKTQRIKGFSPREKKVTHLYQCLIFFSDGY